MTRLQAISVTGYRGFRERVTLDLKPLVLLYGRNNAGKSSLLRLPSIVARSVSDDAISPFDLSGPEGRNAHFLSVPWAGDNLRRIQLELHWGERDSSYTDVFVIRYEDARDRTYVSRLDVKDASGDAVFSIEAHAHPDEHLYTVDGQARTIEPKFVGLVPADTHGFDQLQKLSERLKSIRQSTTWLESVRARPTRIEQTTGAIPRHLNADGANARQILLGSPVMFEYVRQWYAGEEVKRDLRYEAVGASNFRLFLEPLSGVVRQVDLADTGEGMSQVLPVLVGLEMVRAIRSGGVLAVEDPEAHLHGDARRALARRFCEVASMQDPPSIILETHSRTFLLGVQLAIAAGEIDPKNVKVYWVDQSDEGASEVVYASFSKEGAPTSSILQGVLNEDLTLARKLVEVQARRVP